MVAAALERLLKQQHRYRELIDFWDERLNTLTGEEALATLQQVAACWLENLNDPAGALAAVEPLLDDASTVEAACRMLEQIAPAVVWFDEIEMGITAQTSEASELGRIFAFFLTWMQEKASGLFVAATANRIDLLPAEMIRKGRFDEVFFVDLPTDDERVEIFRIHLKRRGVDTTGFDLERLKKFTKGWTGAECEQCVVAACTAARLEDRPVTEDDVLNATATVVPLSKTMKEQVDHIRSWAYDRAVRASPREMQR